MDINTKKTLFYVCVLVVLLSIVSGNAKIVLNNVMKGKLNVFTVISAVLYVVVGVLFINALLRKSYQNIATFKNEEERSIAEKLYSHDPMA